MRTLGGVPKLWDTTIDAHREAVRRATLDATAALIRAHGLSSASMSEIAKQAGVGRATLYKYFPDLDAILTAWHEREVSNHLAELAALRDQPGSADARLERVLLAYATLSRRGQGHGDRAPLLHQGPHVARARQHLVDFVRGLLDECVEGDTVRDDIPTQELAHYCLHALSAAGDLGSKAAVRRLVTVTLAGLRPIG